MKIELSELIKQSYSENEASKYVECSLTKEDYGLIVESAKGILDNFPSIHNCCAPMSAIWTAMIRDNTDIPAYMVAGSLDIMGKRIFGDNMNTHDMSQTFSKSNLDWDGHCWVVFGDCIGEISLFRTAYSKHSPQWLREMIRSQFGEGRGMLLATPSKLLEHGLVYTPSYVLKDSEITGLVKSIELIINKHKRDQ
ncbi:hypothetical protein NIES2119_11185 [[Phormidium ambiguum] IAM M-71]|uniref:Uncharacterized protein n=1 Tax=[Phormidium ambiguum] IAM M-71 TaxID=454136 RepID=A0A1U7ILP7_9CYAN|nr:hypothetical protein [Phormidium ambiguum]OKH38113.1 hypothetical protein NIES2119_11185 [Phormidium ambiguum IAM M-71]